MSYQQPYDASQQYWDPASGSYVQQWQTPGVQQTPSTTTSTGWAATTAADYQASQYATTAYGYGGSTTSTSQSWAQPAAAAYSQQPTQWSQQQYTAGYAYPATTTTSGGYVDPLTQTTQGQYPAGAQYYMNADQSYSAYDFMSDDDGSEVSYIEEDPAEASATASSSMRCTEKGSDGKICNKKFKSKGDLNKHLKHHSKPVKCPFCDKKVAGKRDLQRHIKSTHTKEKDKDIFRCQICDKPFTRDDNLKRHMNNKHSAGGAPQPDPAYAQGTYDQVAYQ